MKNLRKVLALVLVVATLMGFAAMATAAYSDADSIVKKEAVDLLSALEIIKGYEDGSFKPEGKVTRAEMAKMIYVILNGGTDDKAEDYAAACTYADAKNHWAAGYIAFCDAEGIVNGYADGSFKPNGNVTVVEAAKMVLAALGYTSEDAGFTGAKWASAVTKYARAKQLYANVNQAASAQATRETAAQMLLNALQAKSVYASGGSSITVNGVTITQNATFTDNANAWYVDAFGGQLTQVGATTVDFGAPAVQWNYKGTAVKTAATAVASYNAPVSYNTIYNAIGAKVPTTIVVKEDGVTASNTAAVAGVVKPATDGSNKAAIEATIGAAGATTEIYFVEGTLYIIVKNTYAGSVAISDAQATAKKCTITLKGAAATVYADVDNKTAGVTKGAIAIFNLDNGTVKNLSAAKFLTAALNGFTTANDGATITSITLGAVTYELSAKAYGNVGTVEATVLASKLGKDFNAWFDAAGNILYIGEKAASSTTPVTNYGVVLAKTTKVVGDIWNNEEIAVVKLLTTAGTIVEAEITDTAEVGALYKYSVAADTNKYTLGTKLDNVEASATTAVANKTAAITVNGAAYVANLETVFVVETVTGTAPNTVSTYKVYTGIEAVPTLNAASAVVDAASGVAKVVYLFNAAAPAAGPSTTATKLSMVLKTGTETFATNADKKLVTTVKAIVDGKIVDLKIDKAAYDTLGSVTMIEGYTTDKGVISAFDACEGDEATALVVGAKYNKGIMTLNGEAKYVTNAIPAYIYNSKTGVKALQITNITALTTAFDGVAVIVDGAITAVYGTDSI